MLDPVMLVGGGLLSYAIRPGNDSEDVREYVPNLVAIPKWLFVILLTLAGLSFIGQGSVNWTQLGDGFALWGGMEILLAVYLSGCRHGKTGNPW